MPQVKVTFNRNVKYGNDRYAKNAKASVSKKEYEDLFASGVVGEVDDVPEDVNYFSLSREELGKVKNDDLKAFLNDNVLGYESGFTKEQLINVILGEEA
jgi:hypothetical protein